MNNDDIDKLKAYGINPDNYDEYELEEIADTLNTYEENKAYAYSYRKELEAGEESDNGYHEFLQGMADREIISLYENYGIVTNIKIEGWEPTKNEHKPFTTMSSTSIERGDIVRIKREWLNPGETGDELYLVLEECGINRILIQALNTGLPLAPTSVVNTDWVIFHTNINNN